MAAPIKDITSAFNAAVRDTSFFRAWRKRGTRRFWNEAMSIHRGIELTLFKHSWENNQVVGLAVVFAFPTSVQPLDHGYGGISAHGKFIVTTYASPSSGMGAPTYASDRAIHLHDHEDIERLRTGLPRLLNGVVVPFLEHHGEERRLLDWYYKEHPTPADLPLTFALEGAAAARRKLAGWLLHPSEERGGDRLVRWLERYEILEPSMHARFRSADMQARDCYRREVRQIAEELLAAHN